MALTNSERKRFKEISKNFLESFTCLKIKRMSTFGDNGCLVWASDRLNPNTHVVLFRDRGFLHLVSGFKIVLSVKMLDE